MKWYCKNEKVTFLRFQFCIQLPIFSLLLLHRFNFLIWARTIITFHQHNLFSILFKIIFFTYFAKKLLYQKKLFAHVLFYLKCVIRFPDGKIFSMSTNTAKWLFLLFLEVLQQLFSSKSIFFTGNINQICKLLQF